jgi:tRNA-dihydrouridine synthase
MLTNKELGAGLLPSPEKIKRILTESLPKVSCRISVKMRSGLASADEMFNVIPILNQFPLSEVIIHPRIAKQLYVGCADPEVFIRAATISRHPLIYNGDILTIDDFNKLDALFESTSSWMIGRGILKDPFLPAKIKLLTLPDKKEKSQLMAQFHDQIFSSYSKMLSGKSHLLMRMTNFWSYFCFSFPEPAKVFKRIKKAGTTTKYEEALKENFKRLNHNEED